MSETPQLILLQYLALVALVVGVIAYVYKTFRDSTTHYDQDTITRLKESNDILRQENIDLKAQLAAMELRVKSLEQANEVLKGIVTGRDTMLELQKTVSLFLPYVQHFETFMSNDTEMLQRLNIIETILKGRDAFVVSHDKPHLRMPKK